MEQLPRRYYEGQFNRCRESKVYYGSGTFLIESLPSCYGLYVLARVERNVTADAIKETIRITSDAWSLASRLMENPIHLLVNLFPCNVLKEGFHYRTALTDRDIPYLRKNVKPIFAVDYSNSECFFKAFADAEDCEDYVYPVQKFTKVREPLQ